jgi:hypothetical protein
MPGILAERQMSGYSTYDDVFQPKFIVQHVVFP